MEPQNKFREISESEAASFWINAEAPHSSSSCDAFFKANHGSRLSRILRDKVQSNLRSCLCVLLHAACVSRLYYPCIGLSSHVKKRNTDILFSLPVSVLEVFSLVPCSDRRPVCFVRCRTPARKPDLSFRRIFGSSASKWFRCSFFTKQLKRQFNRFFLSVTAGTNNGLKTTLCSGAASVFSSPACRSA